MNYLLQDIKKDFKGKRKVFLSSVMENGMKTVRDDEKWKLLSGCDLLEVKLKSKLLKFCIFYSHASLISKKINQY